MRPQNPSPLECSPTTEPAVAEQPVALRAVGAEKAVGEAVPVGPDPRPAAGPRILALLRIGAADRRAMPTARSWCSCGRDLQAFGHRQIAQLVADHTAHRSTCPLLTAGKEAA
ncbi:hypothetical protein [Streptomyces sp. NPDC056144]|uniref:hypothetical protein n=1 Tax=unclassified Streptomyces TaxID=2593676 RepID=UPI0035DA86E6